MGTWDSGPFDNDTAADWCDALDAAAALVAAQCSGGELVDRACGPGRPLPHLADLRVLALGALDRVMAGPSELLELGAESDGDPWRAGIDRLRATLAREPLGGPLHLC